ncbi:fumarylacetoacetate hydrolase family protein [Calycomorphotria hydatis]|uniref:Fumarylacetoacetate (FAA) hydrolase family protein n=1 Tax=Calycomorphotria hydatis TaxID=2528027 RepID=A0A517TCT2_9PLAN|nr:fumarylacetoacetate hydrolase family protein [Calycomorphotria hydatis]QDT66177.1 Fumarylacetoacetate (FAA) hydrolase family protein [Calycomorphotria hydatis]
MYLARVLTATSEDAIALIEGTAVRLLDRGKAHGIESLADILFDENPFVVVEQLLDHDIAPLHLGDVKLLAPVDRQEVWASGVTYKRSQVARMEESESAASHYDKVYSADRPELFFKSVAEKVVDPNEPVRARADSKWSVPEPELALFISPDVRIVGYTVGNDMSARDIEGENPLYLPQAKIYNQSCALGPWVHVPETPLDLAATTISLSIERDGSEVFQGEIGTDQINRSLTELADWLTREYPIPFGAVLLTGTGIIPPDDFTLEDGDAVSITISEIGTLTNPVVKGS